MSKVVIDRDDKNRVLLTEVLPYEVPMLFSNDGFYRMVSNNHFEYFRKKLIALRENKSMVSIPYDYEIRKNANGDTRVLSIMHPINQLEIVDLYEKYDSLIIHQCSKSPFSLRNISNIAKFCYNEDLVFDEDILKNTGVENEPEILNVETKVLKSYFVYKPVDLVYKFFERQDFQRLEQKFTYMLTFDVSKCFYNIYTHTLSWAVKGKEYAKSNKKCISFEKEFDKKIRQANYDETNGIIVGPEVCRIFAEIILQRVDLDALKIISQRYRIGIDYEVKRYVDDFFVFANDESVAENIRSIFVKVLNTYKLYINNEKTHLISSPFVTKMTVAKREIEALMRNFFADLYEEDREHKNYKLTLKKQYTLSRRTIKNFQCVVKQNDLTYDDLCKDVVRYCRAFTIKLFKQDPYPSCEQMERGLLEILDVCCYAYSMSVSASTTYKFAQIIVLIEKYLRDKHEVYKHNIYAKLNKEIDLAITIFRRKSKSTQTSIETLNLVISLKKLYAYYPLSVKKIESIFQLTTIDESSIGQRYDQLGYFQIVTLLYYIGDEPVYDNIKEKILAGIKRKLQKENNPFIKAELSILFFDIINCPYVTLKFKKELLSLCGYANRSLEDEIKYITDQKQWFMDWDKNIDLESVLKKKEWTNTY